jgi:hypothetical protein
MSGSSGVVDVIRIASEPQTEQVNTMVATSTSPGGVLRPRSPDGHVIGGQSVRHSPPDAGSGAADRLSLSAIENIHDEVEQLVATSGDSEQAARPRAVRIDPSDV